MVVRAPPPHEAALEERALHRMRVQELVREANQSRGQGGCPLSSQAEDRALHEFWDPRARACPCTTALPPRTQASSHPDAWCLLQHRTLAT